MIRHAESSTGQSYPQDGILRAPEVCPEQGRPSHRWCLMLRICQTCDQLHASGTRCPVQVNRTEAHRDASRPSPAARGYDTRHKRRALMLRNQRRPCCLCGRDIDYALHAPDPWSFTAHHLTGDKAGPLDAAHRRCNERAGKPT